MSDNYGDEPDLRGAGRGPGAGAADRPGQDSGNAIRFRWWNLLLAVPLLMLITAFYNTATPTLLGLPAFYWVQFAFVFVGVACVAVVFATTKGGRHPASDRQTRGSDRGSGE